MRLKEATPRLTGELKERLKILEHQTFTNVCDDPNFPHVNSSALGTVDYQFSPNWYTCIQDSLENLFVEYSEDDVENRNFLEVKIKITPDSVEVGLYLRKQKKPTIFLSLDAEVIDEKSGTFKIHSIVITELQLNEDTLNTKTVA